MATRLRSRSGSRQIPSKNYIQQVLSAREGFLAYLPLILTVSVLLIATMVITFFGNHDVVEYQCYASAFWFGEKTFQLLPVSQCQFIPQISQYHTFPLEYPPLSLIVFSLPLLVPAVNYPLMFAIFMTGTVSIIYWLLLKYGPRGAGVVFAVCLLAGSLATTLTRFDIVPAMLTLLCLILAERKHWNLAYIVLALGVLTKGYPIVLFPLLFLAEQRDQTGFSVPDLSVTLKTARTVFFHTIRNVRSWRWKNMLMFTGLVLGVTACSWALNSKEAFGWLSYMYLRPFEVGSTGSVVFWLASFLGVPVGLKTTFGSLNTLSPIAGVVSQVFVILLCLGYIIIIIQQWKGKMDLFQAFLAALLVLVTTSKVFSPQYLIWLIPLLAYSTTGNRRFCLYWGGISILTTLIYPTYYGIISILIDPSLAPGFLPLILIRDFLFVLLVVAYLFDFLHMRERSVILVSTNSS